VLKLIIFILFLGLQSFIEIKAQSKDELIKECSYFYFNRFRDLHKQPFGEYPFQNIHGKNFTGVRPYLYEIDLALHSKLGLEEVVALTRNFTDKLTILTGETGLLQIDNNILLNSDWNVIGAYKNAINNLSIYNITAQDIIKIRKDSLNMKLKKENLTAYDPGLEFKSHQQTLISYELQPDIIEKYAQYGYTLKKISIDEIPQELEWMKNSLRKSGKEFVHLLIYPEYEKIYSALKQFTSNLREMINSGKYSAEEITAYCVREFIIIHPFNDGNGRTGRLLGQLIYKKLTGKTILFPKEFHEESSHSEKHLADLIREDRE
jgi:prophage maintenance system killer protein